MESALVIVEDSPESRDLVAEAGRFAASQGATLYLFAMVSDEELERTLSTFDRISDVEDTTYDDRTALEQATAFLESVATETLGDDVDYETVCRRTDNRVSTTLETAREYDCDHIFTTGRQRSPTGKALFGDFTQSVLVEFEGRVTVDLIP